MVKRLEYIEVRFAITRFTGRTEFNCQLEGEEDGANIEVRVMAPSLKEAEATLLHHLSTWGSTRRGKLEVIDDA